MIGHQVASRCAVGQGGEWPPTTLAGGSFDGVQKAGRACGLTSKLMNVNSLKQTMEGTMATEPQDIRK